MKRESIFLWKVAWGTAAAIVVAGLLFFNFNDLVMWATLNNPFQGQWSVVQLSDGEILYGHLSGVTGTTIGLSDVYLLDKISPEPATPAISSSTGITMGAAAGAPAAQPLLVPISDTPQLFINRAAVLYFKFVTPDDPALPYLH
jgi:hypothetical protein